MKIIGITGGVGSGKSAVLEYFQKMKKTTVCQADLVAHELQQPGEMCYKKIVSHFGEGILNSDSRRTINRKALGTVVFQDTRELKVLNSVIHPAVKERIRYEIHKAQEAGQRLFVLEAALLIEDHYDEICDELWYIYTDEKVRRERLQESRHYSDGKIDSIIANQSSEQRFRENCCVVIDNSGSLEDTYSQIDLELRNRQ